MRMRACGSRLPPGRVAMTMRHRGWSAMLLMLVAVPTHDNARSEFMLSLRLVPRPVGGDTAMICFPSGLGWKLVFITDWPGSASSIGQG